VVGSRLPLLDEARPFSSPSGGRSRRGRDPHALTRIIDEVQDLSPMAADGVAPFAQRFDDDR
jgi:hypothetical protein